jgi:hypothetical protein
MDYSASAFGLGSRDHFFVSLLLPAPIRSNNEDLLPIGLLSIAAEQPTSSCRLIIAFSHTLLVQSLASLHFEYFHFHGPG